MFFSTSRRETLKLDANEADGEYSVEIQSMESAVLSRAQYIEVSGHSYKLPFCNKKRNLFETKTLESVKSEYKYSDELKSMERAVLSRAQYMEVEHKKIRDLTWEASRKVSDLEMDRLREEKETVYSILSELETLEEYKGKVMKDIRKEGRLRAYRVQGFRGLYMEISAISRSCLNIRHSRAIVKAVNESYFGRQVYSKA